MTCKPPLNVNLHSNFNLHCRTLLPSTLLLARPLRRTRHNHAGSSRRLAVSFGSSAIEQRYHAVYCSLRSRWPTYACPSSAGALQMGQRRAPALLHAAGCPLMPGPRTQASCRWGRWRRAPAAAATAPRSPGGRCGSTAALTPASI